MNGAKKVIDFLSLCLDGARDQTPMISRGSLSVAYRMRPDCPIYLSALMLAR